MSWDLVYFHYKRRYYVLAYLTMPKMPWIYCGKYFKHVFSLWKSDCLIWQTGWSSFFQRTPISILLIQSCSYILLILFRQFPKALFHLYLIRSTMLDHEEERWVKRRHDATQFYQQRWVKRTTSRQDLPRGDKIISGDPNPNANNSLKDDDVEDDSYVPYPWARPLSHLVFKPKLNDHSMCTQESSLHTHHTKNGYRITNVTIYNNY
jgi:hypothetical protein